MQALFISDLHLDATAPSALQPFLRFLSGEATAANRLYVLGDLFEAWVGDDDTAEPGPTVASALRGLSDRGTWIGLLHGNRDFLLGKDFCRRAGAHLLPDPSLVELHGHRALVTHGDQLCTDDVDYQDFRARVRNPEWQRRFLAQDLDVRRAFAVRARDASRASQRGKPTEILDANQHAIDAEMRGAGVEMMIHGHTHRPGIHRFLLDGVSRTRIVLGAWGSRAMVLRWDESGYALFDAMGGPL